MGFREKPAGRAMGESVSALIELLFTSHDGITLGHHEESAIHSMGVVIAGIDLG